MTKTNQQTIKYNTGVLEMVKNLTAINNSLIIEKDESGKNIVINVTNPTTTIAYKFVSPVESFDFIGDAGSEIAFYDFAGFFQLFSYFKNPVLQQNTNKLLISENNSKINYLLSDSEVIKKGPKKVAFQDPDIKLQLSPDDVIELEKIINMINAENINISVDGKNIIFKLFNSAHENSFEKRFSVDETITEKIDLTFSSEIFTLLPKENYTLEIKKEGIMKASLQGKDNISLDLYVAEIEGE